MEILTVVAVEQGKIFYRKNSGAEVFNRKLKDDNTFSRKGGLYRYNPETQTIETAHGISMSAPVKAQSKFSINQRFGFLEKFTRMVLDGETASAIVTGEGGLGKSWVVMSQVAKKGMIEGTDYVVFKGFSTPKALYATLYENRDKTVIFDDCDSVLKDPISINILKGALDSYDKRTISWLSKGFIDDGLPSSFDFEGQVIFISNLSIDKIDQAIKSRSIAIDLSMTIQDKIDRMRFILPNVMSDYSMDLKETALEFMCAHADEAVEFNMRTLQKIIRVVHAYGLETDEWQDAAQYLLTNA